MKFYPYWWEDYKPYHFQNCSINNQTYDLVIIGAGYTGICAAQESVSKNLKTLLIDQNALGEGASTRSAGMVSGGLNFGKKVDLFKEYGDQMAVDFIKESIDSYRFLEDRVNGYHSEVKFQKTGRLVLAHSKKKLEALRKKIDLLNRLTNLKLDFLKNIDHEISNDYYKGGMLVHDAASIHPSLFYKFLLDKALNCKLDIFSPCKLLSHKKIENYHIVNTTEGIVKTKFLLFATNGYSEKEIGKENYNIIGVPSYIAVTNEIGTEAISKVMPKLRMYSDTKNDLFYFRPTPDHKRLLFGAFPVWAYQKESSRFVESFFYKNISRILPSLNNFKINYIWGGKVGVTFNTLPHVKNEKNKLYVFGCNGSGVALMPYLGYKSISLITKKTNSPIIITKINSKKNYFKKIISFLLPVLGIYYRKKEEIENKFF
ncbi:MAG: FAD-binding oxidoreductase [alpha proteobacterium HIMB59]|nr:MAG: FAD-binding oxidoreductase [alpha proteobacterium HIMB59]